MSNAGLSGVQLVAALAEQIYHRNLNDDPIRLNTLGAAAIDVGNLEPSGLKSVSSVDGVSYYSTRGFVGQVVQKDGTLYVVFRGKSAR